MAWLVYAILSAASDALVTIFAQLGIKNADFTLTTTVRSVIMSIILVITSVALKKFDSATLRTIARPEFGWLMASEVINGLSWLFYFAALHYGLLAKVTAVSQLHFVFVILFSMLFFGQVPTVRLVAGSLLIIGGMYLVTVE